jgi:hypothetical protein
VQIAVCNNQVGIESILQQTFPVPESTDSGRCRRGRDQCLRSGQARFIEQCRPDVDVPVSQPKIESGVDANHDAYAACTCMYSTDMSARSSRARPGVSPVVAASFWIAGEAVLRSIIGGGGITQLMAMSISAMLSASSSENPNPWSVKQLHCFDAVDPLCRPTARRQAIRGRGQ